MGVLREGLRPSHSFECILVAAHGTAVFTHDCRRKVLNLEYFVELASLQSLVDLQLVLDVEELLQELGLLTLAQLVMLGPPRVELLVEGIHLVFLLRQRVVDLNLDAVAALLQKLGRLLPGQLFDRLCHSLHLGVVLLLDEILTDFL